MSDSKDFRVLWKSEEFDPHHNVERRAGSNIRTSSSHFHLDQYSKFSSKACRPQLVSKARTATFKSN